MRREDNDEDSDGEDKARQLPPCLQRPFLPNVARYMESLLHQQDPDFGPEEKLFDCDPHYLSKRVTYLDDYNNCDDAMYVALKKHKFKSDVYYLAKKCNYHQCRMPGVCNKYGGDKCRFNYPRALVLVTTFHNGVIQLKRLDGSQMQQLQPNDDGLITLQHGCEHAHQRPRCSRMRLLHHGLHHQVRALRSRFDKHYQRSTG